MSGLKWGTWCASPSLQEPKLILRKTFRPGNAVSVYAFGKSDCAVLPVGNKLIRNTLITYDHDDRILRLKNGRKRLNLFKPAVEDRITTVEPIDNYNLVIGFESGLIKTFSLHSYTENPKMSNETTLIGHDKRINSISICVAFSIISTASDDCTCIIWDLNSKSYCRTLYGHPSSVSNTSISKQTGEIVTICALNEQERQSQLRLWTINGALVNAINTDSAILDSCWTNGTEGKSCNAILTAHIDGTIKVKYPFQTLVKMQRNK